MFDKVMVANRGEIAVRIIRTLRALGVRSVAVYSDADEGARHVVEADEAFRIGPGPALRSYLDVQAILDAARRSGADAVHPGYGFLSENASFARACTEAGLVFVGPPPDAVELMGDKIRAKQMVATLDVPVVPGRAEPGMSDADLREAAIETGLPVLLKPSAGGGGKGMHLVRDAAHLDEAIVAARREARGAFGDDGLLVERWIDRPRHIEIQVFADTLGTVVHLGERECSLQRRHQKVIEEAPSPLLDQATREAMGAHAVEVARRCGYVGAGTVEFIVPADEPDAHYFLEMNTRLQVEHPVTELVTGLDLVELQLRVAAGEPLPFGQEDVVLSGHAVEARVYAEDPARGFLPTGGPVLVCREPVLPHVRVDSGLRAGTTVGTLYDPMLAKVIAWAPDRVGAVRRLRRALSETTVLGLGTNIGFLEDLLADPDVVAGRLDTGLVDRLADPAAGFVPPAGDVPFDVLVAAAMLDAAGPVNGGSHTDRWDLADGWRLGDRAWHAQRFELEGGAVTTVRRRGPTGDSEVVVDASGGTTSVGAVSASVAGSELTVVHGGRTRRYHWAVDGRTLWLGRQGRSWALRRVPLPAPPGRRRSAAAADGTVRSPMPGSVVAVLVEVGDQVEAGRPLVVVEAMKMEHTLVAPVAGRVTGVSARVGMQVTLDQAMATVVADGPVSDGAADRAPAGDGAEVR